MNWLRDEHRCKGPLKLLHTPSLSHTRTPTHTIFPSATESIQFKNNYEWGLDSQAKTWAPPTLKQSCANETSELQSPHESLQVQGLTKNAALADCTLNAKSEQLS